MTIAALQPDLYARFSKILKQDQLHHAYLFSGKFGAMDLALWLAQSRFCKQLAAGLPCGTCRECRLVAANDFADLHLVQAEGQTIKIQQIRDLFLTFSQSGFEGNRQVVIIDGAEKMTLNAANALLKSIEEPESEIYILLLTASENRVLETIKSRTQVMRLPHQAKFIQAKLEAAGSLKTDAQMISKIASSIEEATKWACDNTFLENLKQLDKFSKLIVSNSDDAMLQVPIIASLFKENDAKAIAFQILALYFVKQRQAEWAQRVFIAQQYWQANVNFQASLEKLILR